MTIAVGLFVDGTKDGTRLAKGQPDLEIGAKDRTVGIAGLALPIQRASTRLALPVDGPWSCDESNDKGDWVATLRQCSMALLVTLWVRKPTVEKEVYHASRGNRLEQGRVRLFSRVG